MILVDTSVWVDHLRRGDAALTERLEHAAVLMHPYVLGEIASGSLKERALILGLLQNLPSAVVAEDSEVLRFIDRQALHGRGIGFVDAHLLASTALTAGAALWTRDKKLLRVAQELGCAHATPAH